MRTLFTAFLLALAGAASSQNYVPFPNSGAVWVNTLYTMATPPPMPTFTLSQVESFCVNGEDTVINTISYTKVRWCLNANYKGALRDIGGKVMFVPKDSVQEHLLYDFTLNAGDTAYDVYGNWAYDDLVVWVVDSVLIDNTYRKRMQMDWGHWIEGIGNTAGLFCENHPNVSQYYWELNCMSQNDTSLYPVEQPGACDLTVGIADQPSEVPMLSTYPNPASEKITVSGVRENETSNILFLNAIGQAMDVKIKWNEHSFEADLSGWSPGFYIIVIRTPAGIVMQHVIKQ
jgi:hypothetical protein